MVASSPGRTWSGWGWGRAGFSGMVASGAHYFCWALSARTFLSRFQCLRARQGRSWSWRVERSEPFGNDSAETGVVSHRCEGRFNFGR